MELVMERFWSINWDFRCAGLMKKASDGIEGFCDGTVILPKTSWSQEFRSFPGGVIALSFVMSCNTLLTFANKLQLVPSHGSHGSHIPTIQTYSV